MLVLEMSFFGSGFLKVSLGADLSYELNYSDTVVYRNGEKILKGRRSGYVFRSVEQLRYDFERDVAAAGGRLGADS